MNGWYLVWSENGAVPIRQSHVITYMIKGSTLRKTIADTSVTDSLLSLLQLLKQPKLADDCYSNPIPYLPCLDILIIYTQGLSGIYILEQSRNVSISLLKNLEVVSG